MDSRQPECGPQALASEAPNIRARQPSKRGGWSTLPFILGSVLTANIAITGATADVIVYLVKKFYVSGVNAAQMANIINALTSLAPVAGAILCDSYFGCFYIIAIFLFISLLGTVMLNLTALLPSCHGALGSSCKSPTSAQVAALVLTFGLITLGTAGTTYTYVVLGAAQFDKPRDQETYVNWFYSCTTLASVVATTLLVYVLDNVGWIWGYLICALLNAVSLVLFLSGRRWYRQVRPEGSPFVSLARVVVGAIRKCRHMLPADLPAEYYNGDSLPAGGVENPPILTSTLSCLNKAALIVEGDIHSDGSIAKPWRLCSVQQVENLKIVLKLLPLWSTGILLSAAIGIQGNMSILQALTMDRKLGSHFRIPAASFQVFSYLCSTIAIPILDCFFYPVCRKITGNSVTLLHYIGFGHALNTIGMVITAVIESRMLNVVQSHGLANQANAIVPMSSLWLVPQLALAGLAAAFAAPSQLSLYYEEFPEPLKNTGSAMLSVTVGIGYYLSTAIIDAVRRTTKWVPDDLNKGHLDNVYWMLAILCVMNFCYYVVCAKLYRLHGRD